jgi:hypothetical protein
VRIRYWFNVTYLGPPDSNRNRKIEESAGSKISVSATTQEAVHLRFQFDDYQAADAARDRVEELIDNDVIDAIDAFVQVEGNKVQ